MLDVNKIPTNIDASSVSDLLGCEKLTEEQWAAVKKFVVDNSDILKSSALAAGTKPISFTTKVNGLR